MITTRMLMQDGHRMVTGRSQDGHRMVALIVTLVITYVLRSPGLKVQHVLLPSPSSHTYGVWELH